MKKNFLPTLLLCLIFCLANYNQTEVHPANAKIQQTTARQSESPSERKEDFKLTSNSPYEIQRYLEENPSASLKEVWRLLGIEENNNISYVCKDSCFTEIERIGSGGETNNLVLLGIGMPWAAYYEYLIFEKRKTNQGGKASWIFWGSIQSVAQQYAAPEYRTIRNGDKAWFVLNELWGRGSDYVLYGERWYELKKGMKEVLSYPEHGHLARFDLELGRDFKLNSSHSATMPSEQEVRIDFLIMYKMGSNHSRKLFTKKQGITYNWNPQASEFEFNKAKSDISEDELKAIYLPEGLPLEEILQYNFSEFKAIVLEGDKREKEWLTKLMEAIEDSLEKSELQIMLKQHK